MTEGSGAYGIERESSEERRARRAELPAAAAALLAVAFAVFGSHLVHGGFYSDDWGNAARYRANGYFDTVRQFQDLLGGRPVLAALLPVPHALLGVHPAAHIALALVLGALTALCLYRLLRTLRLLPLEAGGISILFLLFPWADSTRLWSTASLNTVAVVLYLLGLTAALRALGTSGRRAALGHAGALALYALSVLTYEVAAAAALVSGALYLTRAPARVALRRWLADVVVVGGALAYEFAATRGTRHVATLTERFHDLSLTVRDGVSLLVYAVAPPLGDARAGRALVVLAVAAVVVAALVRARRPDARALRLWLVVVAGAAVAVVAAYAALLGSSLHPLSPGVANRGNVFAAAGYAVLAYGLLMLLALLLLGPGRRASLLAAAATLALAGLYADRLGADKGAWARAAAVQRRELAAVERGASLPPRSTLFARGYPAWAARGVPVFYAPWDLDGAVQLTLDDPSLHAYPVVGEVRLRCAPDRMVAAGSVGFGTYGARYGRAFLLSARDARVTPVASRAACRRLLG